MASGQSVDLPSPIIDTNLVLRPQAYGWCEAPFWSAATKSCKKMLSPDRLRYAITPASRCCLVASLLSAISTSSVHSSLLSAISTSSVHSSLLLRIHLYAHHIRDPNGILSRLTFRSYKIIFIGLSSTSDAYGRRRCLMVAPRLTAGLKSGRILTASLIRRKLLTGQPDSTRVHSFPSLSTLLRSSLTLVDYMTHSSFVG
jgi:hypothetical protein